MQQSNEKFYLAQQQDGFVEFVLEQARLDDGKRPSIDFNEPMSTLAICNSGGGFLDLHKQTIIKFTKHIL